MAHVWIIRDSTYSKSLFWAAPAFPPADTLHLAPVVLPTSRLSCVSCHSPLPQHDSPQIPTVALHAYIIQSELLSLALNTPPYGPCPPPPTPVSSLPLSVQPHQPASCYHPLPVHLSCCLVLLLISPQLLCLVKAIPSFGSAQTILCLRDFVSNLPAITVCSLFYYSICLTL